jgi:hypothetical protein
MPDDPFADAVNDTPSDTAGFFTLGVPAFADAVDDTPPALTVAQLAQEIRQLLQRATQDLVTIGQKLRQVKTALPHGAWLDWLRDEFAWSESTAQRLLRVAERFGGLDVADLPIEPAALYVLASPSTPALALREAVNRARDGEVISQRRAKEVVARYRQPRTPHPPVFETVPVAEVPLDLAQAPAGTSAAPLGTLTAVVGAPQPDPEAPAPPPVARLSALLAERATLTLLHEACRRFVQVERQLPGDYSAADLQRVEAVMAAVRATLEEEP